MPAMAVTDHGAMFGAIDFYTECVDAGIQPLIGCEVYMAARRLTDRDPRLDQRRAHLTLIAQNEEGYRNLIRLVTLGWTEGFYYKPRIDMELLAAHHAGLIGLSACIDGEIPRALLEGGYAKGRQAAEKYLRIFGQERFFLEAMAHRLPEEDQVRPMIDQLGRELGVPVVATNDSHYTDRGDAHAHNVLLCVQTGRTVHDEKGFAFGTDEFWFKTREEMSEAFGGREDWLDNTLLVAERCDLTIDTGHVYMPKFPGLPEGVSAEQRLRELVEEGLPKRYNPVTDAVRERAETELSIIIGKDYADYFLIVSDLTTWAHQRGIPLSFRGSAGASVVGYALGITDLDPLELDLVFERFLNPERDDPPDIDLDMPDDSRAEIIEYAVQRFGADRVAQVVTFGTLQGRAAVRDAGRALAIPLAEVNQIASLIPPMSSIAEGMGAQPTLRELYNSNGTAKQLLDTAQAIEGLTRHASTHAAALVIAYRPLQDVCPLVRHANVDTITTQYSMDALKKIGVEKLDVLGLKTLTVLRNALALIEQTTGKRVTLEDIPPNDPDTFAMLARGETSGVFQMESAGMRKLANDLQPTQAKHLSALVALYRPGPLQTGMVDAYVDASRGRRKVNYLHPLLEPILSVTEGVIVYQEQVMQIARDLGGFTMGQADMLRRAMGKKQVAIMEEMRPLFLAGAAERGVSGGIATQLFDTMAQFAGYCFNRPHSEIYGRLAYQTAYLKYHYPAPFLSAQLSSYMDDKTKVALYVEEANRRGVEVKPPDVNASQADFAPDAEGNIRFGLAAIKGVGRGVVNIILETRADEPFRDIWEFCQRIPSNVVSKSVIETIIRAGGFDSLGSRAAHMAVLDSAFAGGQQADRDRAVGQTSLFGDDAGLEELAQVHQLPDVPEWPREEILAAEKELLGLYVTGNPLREVAHALDGKVTHSLADLAEETQERAVVVGGIVTRTREYITKGGKAMMFATIQDLEGDADIVIRPGLYEKVRELLAMDRVLVIRGRSEANASGGPGAQPKVVAEEIVPEGQARKQFPSRNGRSGVEEAAGSAEPNGVEHASEKPVSRRVVIHIKVTTATQSVLSEVKRVIVSLPGDDPVVLHVPENGSQRSIALGDRFRATWSGELRTRLRDSVGDSATVWTETAS